MAAQRFIGPGSVPRIPGGVIRVQIVLNSQTFTVVFFFFLVFSKPAPQKFSRTGDSELIHAVWISLHAVAMFTARGA